MKFLVVLACFVVLASAGLQELKDQLMGKIQEHGTKCLAEVHATNDDVAELMAHKIPPTSHEAKCLIFCIHRSFGTIDEDGTPNKQGTMETLASLKESESEIYEKWMQLFDTCTNSLVKDEDPCITATNWAACGVKEAKAIGIPDDMLQM